MVLNFCDSYQQTIFRPVSSRVIPYRTDTMPFTGYFDFLKQRRHDSKEERPKSDDETDATILVSDLRLPVSSKVLISESLRFRQWFQSNPGETEVQLQYVNVHCVWRTLQLMCRGEYTTDPCPKTQLPGTHIRQHPGDCSID
jgi:hypothetical protein